MFTYICMYITHGAAIVFFVSSYLYRLCVMSNVQALLFPKSKYTVNKAKHWAVSNGYHPLKYHVTDNYVRARIKNPDSSRYDYRIGHIANNVKAIYEQTKGFRGGTIGSDLAVGTATVALPLLIYAAKKIYDKVSNKGGGYIGNLRYTSGRSRFRPII